MAGTRLISHPQSMLPVGKFLPDHKTGGPVHFARLNGHLTCSRHALRRHRQTRHAEQAARLARQAVPLGEQHLCLVGVRRRRGHPPAPPRAGRSLARDRGRVGRDRRGQGHPRRPGHGRHHSARYAPLGTGCEGRPGNRCGSPAARGLLNPRLLVETTEN